MNKRMNATEASQSSQAAIRRVAEMQAQANSQARRSAKIWSNQKSLIIRAAVDGKFSVLLTNSLARGHQLELAGFKIAEMLTVSKTAKLTEAGSYEGLLTAALESNIFYFIAKSKHSFVDHDGYEQYVRYHLRDFISRARKLRDTIDDFALLKFLNSVSYTNLKQDGLFDEFLPHLIKINKIVHLIITADESTRPDKKTYDHLIKLMPIKEIERINLDDEIINTHNSQGQFKVSWQYPQNRKSDSKSLITANRMHWLAGEDGQELINFVFDLIYKATSIGKQSINLRYSRQQSSWLLKDFGQITCITIEHMIEIMAAKGYQLHQNQREKEELKISW